MVRNQSLRNPYRLEVFELFIGEFSKKAMKKVPALERVQLCS
jgi:hypothetical protein